MRSWICPEVEDWTSLWECLHDAQLISIEHGALEGTAVVKLKLGFPSANEPGVTTEQASIHFSGTSKIFLSLWQGWPKQRAEPLPEMSSEEWSKELNEWTKKGCEQTLSTEDFSKALSQDKAYILEARGSFAPNRSVIEFEGCFDDGGSFNAFIAGESSSVLIDDQPSSIEELILKGESAWAAWNSEQTS